MVNLHHISTALLYFVVKVFGEIFPYDQKNWINLINHELVIICYHHLF